MTSDFDRVTGHLRQDEIQAYLSEKLGEPIEVLSAKQTYPGFSRQTWLIQTIVGGSACGFALRLDPPWGASVPYSLEHEWRVYETLWKTPVPVAEPLWYEVGQTFADGRALMVRRLVEGSSTVAGLNEVGPAGDARRRRVVQSHIEALATLHSLDWRGAGFDDFISPPPSAADALRFEFDTWRALWRDRRSEAFPLVTEFLCWLEECIPSDTPFVSVVKGNNGVGEEIFKDERLVAMSDFELTSLGDGVLDLAFSQGTLELLGPKETLQLYEQAMGVRVSPERLAFANLWIRFKAIANINGYALWGMQHNGDFRTTCAALGIVSAKMSIAMLAGCIGKSLIDADRILHRGHSGYTDLDG